VRAPEPALTPVVFWFRPSWAFTCAGTYVYITRRLLERLRHEDAVAFVLAHEMAHHDLRHLAPRSALTKAGLPGALAATLILAAENWARGEALERAADDHAMLLCEKAGYDRARCLSAFDILLEDALDHGDVDGALGADDELPDGDEAPRWLSTARKLLRRRSHPPIAERRNRLRRP
jgi:Zn-dependent protease with chaperone function